MSDRPQVQPWVAALADEFLSLEGQDVSSWRGIEMALHGERPPVFTDDRARFLQFVTLGATLGSTTPIEVLTYQNDHGFGLLIEPSTGYIERNRHEPGHRTDSIYRYRQPTELPVGHITAVTVSLSATGDISSVSLTVSGSPLLLVAGEVQERWDNGLAFVLGDESVLVFTDPSAADTVPWHDPNPIRSPHRYNPRSRT